MSRIVALFAIGACACAPSVAIRWADPASLPQTTEADAHEHPAVVLLADERILLDNDLPAKWLRMRHLVIRILTEEGRRHYTNWHVPVGSEEKLGGIQARTISPDGTIHPVADADFIQDEVTDIHDEASPDQEREITHPIVAFPFPDVEVGSTLEYSYVVENTQQWQRSVDDICSFGIEDPDRVGSPLSIPVRRCQVEVMYAKGIHGELQAYNTDAKPVYEQVDSDYWRVRLSVNDVPAWPDEPYRLSPRRRDPWWQFRVRYVSDHGGVDPILGGWDDAARFIADEWLANNDKYTDGFTGTLSKDGCSDKACLVQRAVQLVRDHTDLLKRRAHVDDIRPLKAVWDGGTADSWEKALLTWQLLTSAGVDARLAVATLPDDNRLDRGAPSGIWFEHALVYVPSAEVNGQGTWLDPACENCAPGQVPPRRLGGDALVIDARKDVLRKVSVKTEFMKVAGEPAPRSTVSTSFDVRATASGDAVATIHRVHSGQVALDERLRTRWFDTEARANDDAEFAASRLATGRVASSEPIKCDKATAQCDRKITLDLPGLGVTTPGAIAFPLSVMRDDWETIFRKPDRVGDIQFRAAEEWTDTATFSKPDGATCTWQLSAAADGPFDVPESRDRTSPAAESHIKVEVNGDHVTVTRSLLVNAGIYPRTDYSAIRSVFRDFAHVRREAVVCKRAVAALDPTAPMAPGSASPGSPVTGGISSPAAPPAAQAVPVAPEAPGRNAPQR